jgi:hypothetical protein
MYLFRYNKRRYALCPKCFLSFLKPVLYRRIEYCIFKLSIQKYRPFPITRKQTVVMLNKMVIGKARYSEANSQQMSLQ